MLLIATDEAGYGPKLGPLVIVATAWHVPCEFSTAEELAKLFAPYANHSNAGNARLWSTIQKLFTNRRAALLHCTRSSAPVIIGVGIIRQLCPSCFLGSLRKISRPSAARALARPAE